ncbi:MAG: hypothetical protein JNM91_13330 [Flavobacteriales bacterium]|nr:hypothetical protein [Flavobacteriales bacterium]
MATSCRTRIAPTPSGFLHVGNALNFLLTDELARSLHGTVLLRIDDLDAARTRPEYIDDIFDSLHGLGIRWHEGPHDREDLEQHWRQSSRAANAFSLIDRLRTKGDLYACNCSRAQLSGCTCGTRSLPFDGPETTWRLRLPTDLTITVPGLFGGSNLVPLAQEMPDPVIRQRDGQPAYQIASLADDVFFGMTLIVRGTDLLPSTACQCHIASLLQLDPFLQVRFVHHPLLTDAAGRKLSKSAGDTALRTVLRAGGAAEQLREQAIAVLAKLRDQGL